MHEGILSVIGGTPLVRLRRVLRDINFHLYAKLEALNPGGSMKDRPAYNIIEQGITTGHIKSDTVIIESSSGNMGIGLAQACAYFGLRFICVIDAKTTTQNMRLLQAYGAEVDIVTEPDRNTGEYLQARLDRVRQLLTTVKNGFWPDQYSNVYNSLSHQRTMAEIAKELGRIDYLFCATSTCGTLRGCAEYVKKNNLSTKIYAVDAKGSVIFGDQKGRRLIPGHGAAVRPALFQHGLADQCLHVTDSDCVVGCRRLVKTEAILAGGSSGAVLTAVNRVRDKIPPNATCVMIFPDRGERYLDTIYSDAWVKEYLGDLAELRDDFEHDLPLSANLKSNKEISHAGETFSLNLRCLS